MATCRPTVGCGDRGEIEQTLQSRVNRLKAVYGADLEDPGARPEIMLAVRHVMATSPR